MELDSPCMCCHRNGQCPRAHKAVEAPLGLSPTDHTRLHRPNTTETWGGWPNKALARVNPAQRDNGLPQRQNMQQQAQSGRCRAGRACLPRALSQGGPDGGTTASFARCAAVVSSSPLLAASAPRPHSSFTVSMQRLQAARMSGVSPSSSQPHGQWPVGLAQSKLFRPSTANGWAEWLSWCGEGQRRRRQ